MACGSGLVRIYDFLRTDEPSQYPRTDLTRTLDPAAVSAAALDGSDPLASEALDIFLSIVGAEAGHMALRSLATGGVYICGGIFPKARGSLPGSRLRSGARPRCCLWTQACCRKEQVTASACGRPETLTPPRRPRPGRPRQVMERVQAGGVLEAFLWRASRFHDKVLKHVPLYVVTEEKLGLLGTREEAIRVLQDLQSDTGIAT